MDTGKQFRTRSNTYRVTMPEQSDLLEPNPLASDLRSALEQMRKQAEREIARLNRRLAERELAAENTAATATERQSMMQELSILQHALGEREKTLDQITNECRRLEDELEDQHLAFDDLKQEVESKESSLRAAREEAARLQRELADIQDQSVDVTRASGMVPALATALPLPPITPDPPPRPAEHVMSFSAGLLSGLIMLGIGALLLWGGPDRSNAPGRPSAPPSVADGSTAELPAAGQDATADAAPRASLTAVAPPPQEPPPTQRDRLRTGGFGPTMVVLEGGLFRMGHNNLTGGDSGPEHDVQVAPFLIGAYEVTFQQYDRFVRATGRRYPDDFGWGRGTRPVVGISWNDGQAYVNWLSRQTGKRYRLPSEAEWEYAARAGGRGSYWWGFGLEPGRAVCFDCGTRWDNRSTAPVGSFPASPYGLFDAAGNVMEWVSDCYRSGYEDASADGRARVDGDCAFRVARGGAFNKPASSMRTWMRSKFVPDTRLNNIGLRVSRDP